MKIPVSLLTEKDREELAVGLIVDIKYQCSNIIAVENLRCKVNKKQISCVNPGIIIDVSDGKKSSERVEQLKNDDHEVDEDEAETDDGEPFSVIFSVKNLLTLKIKRLRF